MRGSALDFLYNATWITILPIIFALCIMIVTTFKGTELDQQGIPDNVISALASWDEFFAIGFILLGAVAVALSSRISAHPVFLFFSYWIYAIIVTLTAVIANLYLTIESESSLSTGFVYFDLVRTIQLNMPTLVTIGVFLVGFVVYSRGGQHSIRTGV